MNKNILVTGGAGYIGSHTCYLLTQLGYNVIVLDKFIHNQKFALSLFDNQITSKKPFVVSEVEPYERYQEIV